MKFITFLHSFAHRYLTEMGEKGMISYDGKVTGTPQTSEESDVQALFRLLSNPETAKLLKTLVNGL